MKYCQDHTVKKDLHVVEYFGGTYESAKSDERKEFQRMLTYLKRNKNISYIIVYSYDRFSRTGANAAYISSNLKDQGIHVISVQQECDTSKPSGVFQQNLYYMFSQFDNEQRRDKSVTGMKEKIKQGYWVWTTPKGYTNTNKGQTADKANYVLNEKGKMISKAFQWVNKYEWTLERVAEETRKRGLHISSKRLSDYLRNPFYAGLIVSTLIPGEVFNGKQQKAVSPKVFLQVNDILNGMKKSQKGIKKQKTHEEVPLKGLLYCDICGRRLTAYRASKNKEFYYKCQTVGCSNNNRADNIHNGFEEVLSYFQVDKKHIDPLKDMMSRIFYKLNHDVEEKRQNYTTTLAEIETKKEKLEHKYIFEGLDRAVYQKYLKQLNEEKDIILKELENPLVKLSNLDELVNFSIKTSTNLLSLWGSQNYDDKRTLVNLIFPEGIRYNKENEQYRTERVNTFLSLNNLFSESYKGKKEKGNLKLIEVPALVVQLEL
ncbi:recombinase family protein [Bacteroidota bacterium]